jgi:hypothetical protein
MTYGSYFTCDDDIIQHGTKIGGEGSIECFQNCHGSLGKLYYQCTDYSVNEDWSSGRGRITATLNRYYSYYGYSNIFEFGFVCFSVVIFFWSFGIIDTSYIKCWQLNTAQAGAGWGRGVRDVARINYPSCTDSIKPSLQFSCNFVVINASDGSLCFQIFILYNIRCQVLCGSCKRLPRTSLQCIYIFLVLRDH